MLFFFTLFASIISHKGTFSHGFIPLSLLKPFHKDWTIKVFVLRPESIEKYRNSNGFEKIWKIILMDDEV